MAAEQARELRKNGILLAKVGDTEGARQYLEQSLRLEPDNEAAWLWMVSLAKDARERLFFLHRLLQINPQNEMGLKALNKLGLTLDTLADKVGLAPAPQDPSREDEAAVDVPIMDARRWQEIQPELDAALAALDAAPPLTTPGVTWAKATGPRAGERDIWKLRGAVAGGALASLIVVFLVGYAVVWNVPALRGIVFVPTPTLTPTRPPPTATPTSTPGLTPTPSPTPQRRPSATATVPPELPSGALGVPRPTVVYPPVFERGMVEAVGLIGREQYAQALPTLELEITRVAAAFDVAPYYYAALAQIGAGEYADARATMLEAQERLEDTTGAEVRGTVNGMLAYATALQARQPGNDASAEDLLDEAQTLAESAVEDNPRLAVAHLALAERYAAERSYGRALDALDAGLAVADLAANVDLLVRKGELLLEQSRESAAAQQAFLALYVDPTAASAHRLRTRTALASGDAGLAVLAAQAYLFYHPGSQEAWGLLAEARAAEGNTHLALEAYTQGLTGEPSAALLAGRAAVYLSEGQVQAALADLNAAYRLDDSPVIRAERMRAALAAGDSDTAGADARALLGRDVLPDAEIRLIQAEALIMGAGQDDDALREALDVLNEAGEASLSGELRGKLDELSAQALLRLQRYGDALTAIDAALAAGESGQRYFLRGQIEEALGDEDAARAAYRWVVTWGAVFPYPFVQEARTRLAELQ